MPGWTSYRKLVAAEFIQSREEGRDPAALDALRPAFDAAGDNADRLRDVWRRLLAVPIRPDFPFIEPSDLPTIRAHRSASKRRFEVTGGREALDDKMLGAFLGRCAGCALGKPVEGFMGSHNGLSSRERIRLYHTAIAPGEWPLNDYIPSRSPAEEKTGKVLMWSASRRETIAFMETDDDICYTVIGLKVLKQFGKSFTTRDIAETWLGTLPYRFVCTAETQAYRNLVEHYDFHHGDKEEIDWTFVATRENPYREWIGAQIRADPWGYAAPGNPELAAEFAWRDARMTHVKNGIYGEMFCAAMVAAAFALNDPLEIVKAGLAEIPSGSRLAADIRRTIKICARHENNPDRFEEVFGEIEAMLGHYDAVHTNNNAALVVAALLLGKHDFHRVITLAVMGGWDTDCNGATAGSICGAMVGAGRIPTHWTGRLNDTLRSGLVGYDPIAISECAKQFVEAALR